MKKNFYLWLLKKIRRRIPALALMTAAQVGQALFSVWFALGSRGVIDSAVSGDREAFYRAEDCFRIGGDEFVYLCHSGDALAQKAAHFGEVVRQEAQSLSFPFRVAIGYACYDPVKDRALRDVIRRSDEMMYRNKELQKLHDMPFGLSTDSVVSVEN